MPSHAVGLSQVRSPAIVMHDCPAASLRFWTGKFPCQVCRKRIERLADALQFN